MCIHDMVIKSKRRAHGTSKGEGGVAAFSVSLLQRLPIRGQRVENGQSYVRTYVRTSVRVTQVLMWLTEQLTNLGCSKLKFFVKIATNFYSNFPATFQKVSKREEDFHSYSCCCCCCGF